MSKLILQSFLLIAPQSKGRAKGEEECMYVSGFDFLYTCLCRYLGREIVRSN
jgi:hypothetical protein